MQKVERRKKKGRGGRGVLRVLGCAALLALTVTLTIRLNWKRGEVSVPDRTETGGSIENRDVSEIQRLTIRIKGGEAWTAERAEDGELYLDGSAEPIDKTLGNRLQDAMANIVYEAVLTEDRSEYQTNLAEFGLAEPELIATALYTDGTGVTLRFGADSGLEDAHFHYMTVDGDDRLFAAADSLLEDLRVEPELLQTVLQPEIHTARIDRITVREGDGAIRTEWRLQGDIYDADAAENWLLTAPVTYPADFDTMVGLKKNAGNLRLGIRIGDATEENLQACGLTPPETILEIHLAAGETGQISEDGAYNVQSWEESTLQFDIGAERNDMTRYVRMEDGIYTMNSFTLETLIAADPLSTVARYVAPVALEALSSLTVETEAGATVYTLTRETAEVTDEAEAETVITCRKNDTEIPYSTFEAAYERLMVVTVSGRLPEEWQKKETEVRTVFRSVSGKEHTVELSPFDALHDAVTVDGCTLFYLIRSGMPELP